MRMSLLRCGDGGGAAEGMADGGDVVEIEVAGEIAEFGGTGELVDHEGDVARRE